jgi:hypothetical protein
MKKTPEPCALTLAVLAAVSFALCQAKVLSVEAGRDQGKPFGAGGLRTFEIVPWKPCRKHPPMPALGI